MIISPFSLIEHLWDVLEQQVHSTPQLTGLKESVGKSQDTFRGLESMPQQVRAVLVS